MQSLLRRLGPSHPDAQSLRAQLGVADDAVAAEIARVVAATEAGVRGDRERVATLEQDLREVQRRLEQDSQAQISLNAMQRDAEASRSLLQAVLERMQETAQLSAIETPDAHEISLALPPARPSSPRVAAWMAAATASGTLLGLLLVYLRELADNTFHSGDDIRSVLGLPCFALIPRIPRGALGRLTLAEYAARKPLSPFAEQLRALRAGLSLWHGRPRIVAVTAARAQEGKTTVTLALGRLAAMNGERVIVVDCDIRQSLGRPTQGDMRPGLVDCLQGRAVTADVIQKDAGPGMDYLPCGHGEADTLGLLMSATMAQLLQTLQHDYDLVLLDAPPAQAITDARIVCGLAEATLLCVRWCGTPRDKVLNTLEALEAAHANVVGAALTQVDVSAHVRSGYADAEVYHPRHGGYFRE
jgi:capsular exopolysaccharide synthesis family protein